MSLWTTSPSSDTHLSLQDARQGKRKVGIISENEDEKGREMVMVGRLESLVTNHRGSHSGVS